MRLTDPGRLERCGGIRLNDAAAALIDDLFVIWNGRDADNAALVPQPFWQPSDLAPIKQHEAEALAALVEELWSVWHECGGRGQGTRWDLRDPNKHGKFILFLFELFKQKGAPAPSPRTLRRILSRRIP